MWGLVEFAVLVLMCLSSAPIAFSLGMVGVIFAWIFYGDITAATLAGITVWICQPHNTHWRHGYPVFYEDFTYFYRFE